MNSVGTMVNLQFGIIHNVQYDHQLKAKELYLKNFTLFLYQRTLKVFEDLICLTSSVGALVNV